MSSTLASGLRGRLRTPHSKQLMLQKNQELDRLCEMNYVTDLGVRSRLDQNTFQW
jgi:hypothetical protein